MIAPGFRLVFLLVAIVLALVAAASVPTGRIAVLPLAVAALAAAFLFP